MKIYQSIKLFLLGIIAGLLLVLVLQSRPLVAQYSSTEVEISNTNELARKIAREMDGMSVSVSGGSIEIDGGSVSISGSVDIDEPVEVEGSVTCY